MELKRSDVNSLESKLEEFSQSLPEQEKNVLGWIVARAKAAPAAPEVEISDADLDSVSGGLEDAAGFTEEYAERTEIIIKWVR